MYTLFFISNTFIGNAKAEIGGKIRKKLCNKLRLNFCYLKTIGFLHPRYHPKVKGNILKDVQNTSTSV